MLEAGVRNSHFEELLDGVFSVDTIRIFKPDLQVYQLVFNQLGCDPQKPGTFPDLLLLVLRPCGPIVLDRLRNAYREIPFLK